MIIRLRSKRFNAWHIEQKLTVFLMIIIALYNNPFYGIKFVSWTVNYVIDSIFAGVISGYIVFFNLTLFDSLRSKNRDTTGFFYLPKIIISAFISILVLITSLLKIYEGLKNQKSISSPLELTLIIDSFLPYLVFVAFAYIVFEIVLVFREIDPTETYKLNLYILTFSICVLGSLIGYKLAGNNALIFTVKYAIISLFGILMAYFHWPYDVGVDQNYDETKDGMLHDQNEPGFFENRDDE